MDLATLVALLAQEAPEIIALIGQIVQAIKDNRQGVIDAQTAESQANVAMAQLLGRQNDSAAQDAADLAAVTAEMAQKSGGK